MDVKKYIDLSIDVVNQLINETISWEDISQYLDQHEFRPSVLDNHLLFMAIHYNKKTVTQKILKHKHCNPYIRNINDLPISFSILMKRKTITKILLDYFKSDFILDIRLAYAKIKKAEIAKVYADADKHYNTILRNLESSPVAIPRPIKRQHKTDLDHHTFVCSPFS